MPFRKNRPVETESHYVDPIGSGPRAAELTKKEQRKLAKMRKAAQRAAVKAARQAEKAREAARKVREAGGSAVDVRERAVQNSRDVPDVAAGKDRSEVLAQTKKEQRRLNKLRRKAQRSS